MIVKKIDYVKLIIANKLLLNMAFDRAYAKRKIYIILIIIVVFVAGFYLYAQRGEINRGTDEKETLNEDTEWVSYNNEKFGYILKYPNGWYLYSDNPSDVFVQPKEENANAIPGPHSDAMEISVIKMEEDKTISDIINDQYKKAGVEFNQEPINIGGIEGFRTRSVCEGLGCGNPEWFVGNNGYLYNIKSNLGYSDIFDKIILNFSFKSDNQ